MMSIFKKLCLAITLFVGFASVSAAAPVAFKAHGSWDVQTGSVPAYWAEKGFWLDATVQNLGAVKKVGIAWTDNNWATNQKSYLSYEYSLPNNYEQWGLDFKPLGRLDSYYIGSWRNYITNQTRAGGTSVTIEYAIFYEVNGNTYWDNNSGQNYKLTISL